MKNLNLIKVLSLSFFLLFTKSMAYAQFEGPGATDKIYSVKEVIERGSHFDRLDVLVKVQGYIVKQINADMYEFSDKTGKIKIEIDRKRLPKKPFNDKTELLIIGVVDNDLFKPVEIEAKEVKFVD